MFSLYSIGIMIMPFQIFTTRGTKAWKAILVTYLLCCGSFILFFSYLFYKFSQTNIFENNRDGIRFSDNLLIES